MHPRLEAYEASLKAGYWPLNLIDGIEPTKEERHYIAESLRNMKASALDVDYGNSPKRK